MKEDGFHVFMLNINLIGEEHYSNNMHNKVLSRRLIKSPGGKK